VINPEDLEEKDVTEPALPGSLNGVVAVEKIRDFEKFKTELGTVLEFISNAGDGKRLKKALEEKEERWSVLGNEEINLINICLKEDDKGYPLAEIFSMTSDADKRAKLYEEYGVA